MRILLLRAESKNTAVFSIEKGVTGNIHSSSNDNNNNTILASDIFSKTAEKMDADSIKYK